VGAHAAGHGEPAGREQGAPGLAVGARGQQRPGADRAVRAGADRDDARAEEAADAADAADPRGPAAEQQAVRQRLLAPADAGRRPRRPGADQQQQGGQGQLPPPGGRGGPLMRGAGYYPPTYSPNPMMARYPAPGSGPMGQGPMLTYGYNPMAQGMHPAGPYGM